jgi:hypothetical protein
MVNNSININKKNIKRPQHMALEMQALAGNRHTNVAELNRLLVSQPSQLEQQQKYKQIIKKKNTNRFPSTQKTKH